MASSKLSPVIRHLVTLPRELIHKVIDSLCLSQVLSLALHNVPYIDECILGHFNYKRLFQEPSQLHKSTEYFRLYYRILFSLCISPHKHTSRLAVHPAWSNITYSELVAHLHIQVVHLIDKVTPREAELAVLSALSPTPLHTVWDSSDLQHLQFRWTSLSEVTRTLNVKKSEQLQRLRALALEYPGQLRVDLGIPDYKGNVNHMTNNLEWRAKDLLRPRRGIGGKRAYPFKKGLPVLPYDRHLRLFLKVLERYPLPDKDMPGVMPGGGISVEAQPPQAYGKRHRQLLNAAKIPNEIKAKLNHQYTPEAIGNIRRAILGLTYSYTSTSTSPVPPESTWPVSSLMNTPAPTTGDIKPGFMPFGSHTPKLITKETPLTEPINMRTKQTPYSAYPHNKSHGLSQPCFVLPNRVEAYAALPEMEIQWLESFLWSCKYMANMHDAKWNETMSVGEMWCKKSQCF